MPGRSFRFLSVALLISAYLLAGQAATNPKQTWKGVLWDNACAELHGQQPDTNEAAKIIRHCVVDEHHRPVLVVNGRSIVIINADAVYAFLAHRVIVEGTLKEDAIIVTNASFDVAGPAHEGPGSEGGIISQLSVDSPADLGASKAGPTGPQAVSSRPARKPTVAILNFGYDTVATDVNAIFGSNVDIGKGIGSLLAYEMVKDGNYRVIERSALQDLMKEQNLSNSNRVDAATAAKIGALLGVDYVLIGDVTQFGRDDKRRGIGGGCCSYGLGGVGAQKAKAVVEVTARVVDVKTGEILASATGRGESDRSSTNMLAWGGSAHAGGGGQLDMGSSNFSQTILGEAVKQSVDQLAAHLDEKAASLPTPAAASVEGVVADATGSELVVNIGAASGVHVGDKLAVMRVSRTIVDFSTGTTVRSVEAPVGTMTVVTVDANSASGTFTGSGTPKVGDKVKRPEGT